jgi:predicted phosphodiesterase
MHYAIIADIHSNLEAFTAVLEDMERRGGADEIWCLGDVIGYGPDPHRCLALLRKYNHICVAGNHDWGAIGKVNLADFNPDAAAACRWTGEQLSPEDIRYLEALPLTLEKEVFTLAHGSPREPIWEYVISASIASQNFHFFGSSYCLVGHSHVPLVFRQEDGSCSAHRPEAGVKLALGESRLIINPGGVGQPRDGNPRASYATYDSETGMVMLHRVPYDIVATQNKMMQQGLPVRLVVRLSQGL